MPRSSRTTLITFGSGASRKAALMNSTSSMTLVDMKLRKSSDSVMLPSTSSERSESPVRGPEQGRHVGMGRGRAHEPDAYTERSPDGVIPHAEAFWLACRPVRCDYFLYCFR